MYDILIKNGTIIDGSGRDRYEADIAIQGDRIIKILPDINDEASQVIDAKGLFVSPGFIDTHSHAEKIVLFPNSSWNILLQGITFQFMGQCGDSPVPYTENLMGVYRSRLNEKQFAEMLEKISSPARFVSEAQKQRFGINFGLFIGHQAIRAAIMGYKNADPNEDEMMAMNDILEAALSAGYWGMSSGLVYVPSVYAKTEELVELSKTVASHGGIYATHVRGEGNCVMDAVAEAIQIGHESGAQVQISHLKVMGHQNKGKSRELLQMIDNANLAGDVVFADQYPFDASSAPLLSQIPPQFLEGGNASAVEKLKDHSIRKKIEWSIFNEQDLFESAFSFTSYDKTIIAEAPFTPQYIGMSLTELGSLLDLSPFDAYCEFLIANHGEGQGVYINQNQEDICRIMKHPRVFCGCDWAELPLYHEENEQGGAHPRCIGTMAKRLQTIRDLGLTSAEEAICSITGRVAEAFGIHERGILQEGNYADICVLDYENVRCNADYVYPFRHNSGICHVIVNGKIAVQNGVLTGQSGGRIVLHDH